jgi:HK97 gp10 family phage protein
MGKTTISSNNHVTMAQAMRVAERIMEKCKEEAQKSIQATCPVRTGQLRDSHYYQITKDDTTITLEYGSELDYAPFVAFGTSKQAPNPYFVQTEMLVKQTLDKEIENVLKKS